MHECTEIELLYNSNYFSQYSYNEIQLHNEHQVATVGKVNKKKSLICIFCCSNGSCLTEKYSLTLDLPSYK